MRTDTLFLDATRHTVAEIERLFDFFHPVTLGLRRLQLQVSDRIEAVPKASAQELGAWAATGTGLQRYGALAQFADRPWADVDRAVGELLLVSLVAAYEGWTVAAMDELVPALGDGARGKLAIAMQHSAPRRDGDVLSAVADLNVTESDALVRDSVPLARKHPKYSGGHLGELLVVFRWFKETRNAVMHLGGRPTRWAPGAHQRYRTLPALPFRVPPIPSTMPVTLSVTRHDAVGFSDIVQRMLVTLDTELMRSHHAEALLVRRWSTAHRKVEMTPRTEDRQTWKRLRALGFCAPQRPRHLVEILRDRLLIVGLAALAVACAGSAPVAPTPTPAQATRPDAAPRAVVDAAPAAEPGAVVDAAPAAEAPQRSALADCELPVAREVLVPVPDVIEFELSLADRVTIGRALAVESLRLIEEKSREAVRVGKEYDDWIAAGAPVRTVQAVRLGLDPDDAVDRVVVLTHDALTSGTSLAVVAALDGKPWMSLLQPFHDPAMRVLAAANIDADPWTELVLVQDTGTRRFTWWLTAQLLSRDRWGRFAHIEDIKARSCAAP